MAQLVVTAVLVEGRRERGCRTYGVSRRWVITLVQRDPGRGRTRPDTTPATASLQSGPHPAAEDEIIALRKTSTATATKPARPPGGGSCAPNACRLRGCWPSTPSMSTAGRHCGGSASWGSSAAPRTQRGWRRINTAASLSWGCGVLGLDLPQLRHRVARCSGAADPHLRERPCRLRRDRRRIRCRRRGPCRRPRGPARGRPPNPCDRGGLVPLSHPRL